MKLFYFQLKENLPSIENNLLPNDLNLLSIDFQLISIYFQFTFNWSSIEINLLSIYFQLISIYFQLIFNWFQFTFNLLSIDFQLKSIYFQLIFNWNKITFNRFQFTFNWFSIGLNSLSIYFQVCTIGYHPVNYIIEYLSHSWGTPLKNCLGAVFNKGLIRHLIIWKILHFKVLTLIWFSEVKGPALPKERCRNGFAVFSLAKVVVHNREPSEQLYYWVSESLMRYPLEKLFGCCFLIRV